MILIILLAVVGAIVVGFMVWLMFFSGKKNPTQGNGAEATTPEQGRASGLD